MEAPAREGLTREGRSLSLPKVLGLWYLATGAPARKERHDYIHRGGGGRGKPKLSDEAVRAIRKDTRPASEIAVAYGITEVYANQVRNGQTHVRVLDR